MGYSYGLFRVQDTNIDHLSKITDKTVLPLRYGIEEIKKVISGLLPLMDWDEYYGQIINPDWGRFECLLSAEENRPVIIFVTSYHVDYEQQVLDVAKQLNLSAFDSQTGECIYMQNETE